MLHNKQDGTQTACFKGSLLWNSIAEKHENIKTLKKVETQIKLLNPSISFSRT